MVEISDADLEYSLEDFTPPIDDLNIILKVVDISPVKLDSIYNAKVRQAVLADDTAKQLSLKFVHEADAKKVQSGYIESFKSTLGADGYAKLQSDVDTFVGFFKDNINKGDEVVLRWIPGGTIVAIVNGSEVGEVKNPEFAKALWSIWFGDKSIVSREQLVSQIGK